MQTSLSFRREGLATMDAMAMTLTNGGLSISRNPCNTTWPSGPITKAIDLDVQFGDDNKGLFPAMKPCGPKFPGEEKEYVIVTVWNLVFNHS